MKRWLTQLWLFVQLVPHHWKMTGHYLDMRGAFRGVVEELNVLANRNAIYERETLPDRTLN